MGFAPMVALCAEGMRTILSRRTAPEFVATTVARDVAECRGKKANSPSSRQKLTSQLSRGESLRSGLTASVMVNRRSAPSPLAKVTVAVGSGPRLFLRRAG